MRKIAMIFIGMVVLIGLHGHASAAPSTEEILQAVVKIRSTIPKEADSAGTLGTEREGNGIIIDSEGTILTAPANPNFGGAALINPEGHLVGIGSLLTQVLILHGSKIREIKVRSMDRYQHFKPQPKKELIL
jgi:S1-C subfamily serine protease